jgi:hypothetical protein
MSEATDSTQDRPVRQRSEVQWGDPDFTVRVAATDDLLRIQRENVANGWVRRWSSEEALLRQIESVAGVFLCPMLRNDGPVTEPESYRCWAWFVLGAEDGTRGATLLDVSRPVFETLPELESPTELRRVIKATMARVMLGSRYEAMW